MIPIWNAIPKTALRLSGLIPALQTPVSVVITLVASLVETLVETIALLLVFLVMVLVLILVQIHVMVLVLQTLVLIPEELGVLAAVLAANTPVLKLLVVTLVMVGHALVLLVASLLIRKYVIIQTIILPVILILIAEFAVKLRGKGCSQPFPFLYLLLSFMLILLNFLMKIIFFYIIIAAAFLMIACNKDKDEVASPNEITLTTTKSSVLIQISGYGTMTIDWGDNTKIETFSFTGADPEYVVHDFTHTYSVNSMHAMTIRGDSITHFGCAGNGLTKLDVSKNPALIVLLCGYNPIEHLDVKNNIALVSLLCYRNQLTDLDVSNNPELVMLNCLDNQITKLDVSKNIKLYSLSCPYNYLTTEALNTMFGTLHNFTYGRVKEVDISGNPGMDDCDKNIAENKGWGVIVTN